MRLKLRLYVLLAVLALCLVWVGRLHSQELSVLFGSYNGAAKAVAVDANGAMKVSIAGGGALPASPYVVGDLLAATSTTAFSTLSDTATGKVFASGGVGALPAYTATPTVTSLFVANGTAAAPSIAFSGDTTTGWFSDGAGIWKYSSNGVEQLKFSTAGVFTPSPGSHGTTPYDGFVLVNGQAATAGIPVEISPRFRFRANVWNTTAVAANNLDDWELSSLPVSGLTPSSIFRFGSSLNGGATTFPVTFSSAGKILATTLDSAGATITIGGNANITAAGNLDGAAIRAGNGSQLGWSGRTVMLSPLTRQMTLTGSSDVTVGVGLDFATASVLKIRTVAQTGYATLDALGYNIGGVIAISGTAPTVTGFCATSPSVPNANGTAAFTINVGTVCAASTGSISLPTATTGWVVDCHNVTNPAANYAEQTGGTTATATLQNYSRTTGTALNWTASDILRCTAMAY